MSPIRPFPDSSGEPCLPGACSALVSELPSLHAPLSCISAEASGLAVASSECLARKASSKEGTHVGSAGGPAVSYMLSLAVSLSAAKG